MTATTITPLTLWTWLHDGEEIVVADVRDGGPYSRSHILVAASIPLAQIEYLAPTLIPHLSTHTVIVDNGDETHAQSAAEILIANGYSNIHVLEGGNTAWERAGYQLFSGSGIISKAFGELVEHELDTPRIDAHMLKLWQDEQRNFISVDSRPLAEYRTISLPNGADCPGAELVLRVPALLEDESTPIVVNCAGRTRSIIGAQSLRNAGVRNPIYALKNGTMGWMLEGFEYVKGAQNMVPEPAGEDLERAQTLARHVQEEHGVRTISLSQLDKFLNEEDRTTYVFDVRQSDVYERGHIPGSVHAAGGQLVQATDTYAAVRNARIVLVDEHMVQSVMTAHWLQQMGWDVFVLEGGMSRATESGARVGRVLNVGLREATGVHMAEIHQEVLSGVITVIDVGESYWYREGRIPGSYYAMRSHIVSALSRFATDSKIVFCCSDGRTAPLAASDALKLGYTNVAWLRGGRGEWKKLGESFERIGEETDLLLLTETDDMWYPPWARKEGVEEAIMQYLTWETGLLEPVSRETYLTFSLTGR
jgi:rhodanese-related sulfurtransferase